MPHLPFRRIAIFQPELVLTRPDTMQASRQLVADIQLWQAQVRSAGADAVYARLHGPESPLYRSILKTLRASEMALLAPALYQDTDLQPTAWHFRRTDALPTSPDLMALRGRACHNIKAVLQAQAEGMDYVFLSPIFSTPTHPQAPALGLENLRSICAEVDIPVFALGGINPEREKACRLAGAWGIAGIRMFLR